MNDNNDPQMKEPIDELMNGIAIIDLALHNIKRQIGLAIYAFVSSLFDNSEKGL